MEKVNCFKSAQQWPFTPIKKCEWINQVCLTTLYTYLKEQFTQKYICWKCTHPEAIHDVDQVIS